MILAEFAKVLGNDGPEDHHCDMDIRVLPSGSDIRITQALGEGSTGCRLNLAALERFVDGIGEASPPVPEAIYAWCRAAISAKH